MSMLKALPTNTPPLMAKRFRNTGFMILFLAKLLPKVVITT
jgi:hypothetical protein